MMNPELITWGKGRVGQRIVLFPVHADLARHPGCDKESLKRQVPFAFETGPAWSLVLRFLPVSSSTGDEATQ
jgi:hypothetical protein